MSFQRLAAATFDATAPVAVFLDSPRPQGFTAVLRNGVGDWTVTLGANVQVDRDASTVSAQVRGGTPAYVNAAPVIGSDREFRVTTFDRNEVAVDVEAVQVIVDRFSGGR